MSYVALDLAEECGALESDAYTADFQLVSGSGRVSPTCQGGYPAEPTFPDDDTCIAYELVDSVGVWVPQYELGYVAVYLAGASGRWIVSGYTSNSSSAICGRRCNGLWARRVDAR